MNSARNPYRGFSLVEVVMALGIVSFALVALLGLLSVGLRSSKQAGDDTEMATISWQVIGRLRNKTPALTVGTAATYYFDIRGQEVTSTNTTAYYVCTFNTRRLGASEVSSDTTNTVLGTLQFTWPASIPAAQRPNTNKVYATFPPQ